MKFSIITPTHLKNAWLTDLYDSLVKQTHSDWEWIIYLNGGATAVDVPNSIRADERVRLIVDNSNNKCVGYNKNRAFKCGSGDVLVEVDHDDILTPDCLEELQKAFESDSNIGFVFSDDAIYHMKEEPLPYNPIYGWTSYRYNWQDKNLLAHNCFEPSSRSMSFIWYAPDHVRAWRSDVYNEIGGHNPELDICDDHELMIRTYLHHTKMHHIPKVLYIYRVTGDNTWLERNAAIQTKTVELFRKYAWDLACKDARDNNLHIVELGGGINPKAGCNINIDMEDGNMKWDLNDGIPLPDNSVGVIWASHIIEHLHDKQKIMSEIHRVLVDGGWAFIQVPSTDGRGAWQDPTHVSFWNENSFWYYTRKNMADFIRNKDIKFQEFKLDTFWWENNIAITDAWLVAVKSNARRPHSLMI
jgi:glycosyltransferase involved in cell wall biosynthesis